MDPRQFFREEVATRPVAAGAVAALLLGCLVGAGMSAGLSFEQPEQGPITPLRAEAMQPVSYMTDVNGRVPDYVVGTDNVPGAPARRVTPVVAEAPKVERKRFHWFWPPSWSRERRDEPATPPPTAAQTREAARSEALHRQAQERARQQLAAVEAEAQRQKRDGGRGGAAKP